MRRRRGIIAIRIEGIEMRIILLLHQEVTGEVMGEAVTLEAVMGEESIGMSGGLAVGVPSVML